MFSFNRKAKKADIAKKLDDILKKKINISFSVDPSLLVGSILQIGSTMIDTSAKTRLNNFKSNLKGYLDEKGKDYN